LLKTTPSTVQCNSQGRRTALLRLLLEERVYGALWIASDDKAFLFRPWLALLALRLRLFGHLIVLSQGFLPGVLLVPRPGIEPGSPKWARGCKPRLSAISSTGGQLNALDAVAGSPVKSFPVTAWFFRPSSAALLPLPSLFSSPITNSCLFLINTEKILQDFLLNVFRRLGNAAQRSCAGMHWLRRFFKSEIQSVMSAWVTQGTQSTQSVSHPRTLFFYGSHNRVDPQIANRVARLGFDGSYFSLLRQSLQGVMNRDQLLLVFGKIKSHPCQFISDFGNRNDAVDSSYDVTHSVSKLDRSCDNNSRNTPSNYGRNPHVFWQVFVCVFDNNGQTIHDAFPVGNLSFKHCALGGHSLASLNKRGQVGRRRTVRVFEGI
jgi:hypothetical protein